MVLQLTNKVEELRGLVMHMMRERDPEGEYKPAFVKEIRRIAQKKRAGVRFTSGKDLFKKVKKSIIESR